MSSYVWDFRSDTVTVPTDGMKKAMMEALVGDDVYGEDPSVIALEQFLLQLSSMQGGALFVVSGTMSNQIAVRLHTDALDEIICDSTGHILNYEVGGVSYHSRGWIRGIKRSGKYLTRSEIEENLQLDDELCHKPLTRLIALENTLGGSILPLDEIKSIHLLAKQHGFRMHLDGARIWNACIATGVSLAEYCKYFDTVSVCLSKGLGAPIGSVLLTSTPALAKKARHYRKLFGGGWRQAGMLAAAGRYAIEYNWQTMRSVHQETKRLAESLVSLGFSLPNGPPETNVLYISSEAISLPLDSLADHLKTNHRIAIAKPSSKNPYVIRVVLHFQTPPEAVTHLIDAITQWVTTNKS